MEQHTPTPDLAHQLCLGITGNTPQDRQARIQAANDTQADPLGIGTRLSAADGDVLHTLNTITDLPGQIHEAREERTYNDFIGMEKEPDQVRDALYTELGEAYRQLKDQGTIIETPARFDSAEAWATYLSEGSPADTEPEMMAAIRTARNDGARSISDTIEHPAVTPLVHTQLGLPSARESWTEHDQQIHHDFKNHVARHVAASLLREHLGTTHVLDADLPAALHRQLNHQLENITADFQHRHGLPTPPEPSTALSRANGSERRRNPNVAFPPGQGPNSSHSRGTSQRYEPPSMSQAKDHGLGI